MPFRVSVTHAKSLPVIVTEIELREVAMQVALVAVLVGAAHAELEHQKAAFNRIRGHVVPSVFLLIVVDVLVGGELLAERRIDAARQYAGGFPWRRSRARSW